MGEKDTLEKYLESFNDVFVDIYNVLWFKEEVLKEEYLQPASTETIYKAAEGNVRNQQRDIAKKYVVDGAVHYVFGIENQSEVDDDMPVRVMGYDYGNYRKMVDDEKDASQVVTIVLNFSEDRWKKPTDLDGWASMPPDGRKKESS